MGTIPSKSITLEQYFKEVTRTLPDLGGDVANETHMVAGIVTEISEVIDIYKKHLAYGKELDMEHLQEEMIDIVWYAANLAIMLDVPADSSKIEVFLSQEDETIKQVANYNTVESITHWVEALLNLEFNPMATIAFVALTMKAMGMDFYEGLAKNIAKLNKRYPDGFSQEKAINR